MLLRRLAVRCGRPCSPTNRHRLCLPDSPLRRTGFFFLVACITIVAILFSPTAGRTLSLLLPLPGVNCTSPFVRDCNCFSANYHSNGGVDWALCGLAGFIAYGLLAFFVVLVYYTCSQAREIERECRNSFDEFSDQSGDENDRDFVTIKEDYHTEL